MEGRVLFLNPVFTRNIWGGSRLAEEYGYEIEGVDIGECWGIAAHPKGDVTIREGSFKGERLSTVWENYPNLFGQEMGKKFPLLVKIIDAKEDLSIQVHPDDAYACVHEKGSFGKTECWYILDCDENASLVVGHNAKTREELVRLIDQKDWGRLIREIPVKKGDFIQIDPGTVHAIKGGIMLLETQQNSDITYRVYDYDRVWDGKARDLHLNQSKEVIAVPAKPVWDTVIHDTTALDDIQESEVKSPSPFIEIPDVIKPLADCRYYRLSRLLVHGRLTFSWKESFLMMTVVEGEGFIQNKGVKKGDHMILLPDEEEALFEGRMKLLVSAANKQ